MDSESNSSEMLVPKIEFDVDSETSSAINGIPNVQQQWTSTNTKKLIELLRRDCRVLWDVKHRLYKDRMARQTKIEYLADYFGTSTDEINRKIHNLRTQFNHELRKIKRRQEEGKLQGSGWEHFHAMSFLLSNPLVVVSDTPRHRPLPVIVATPVTDANDRAAFAVRQVIEPVPDNGQIEEGVESEGATSSVPNDGVVIDVDGQPTRTHQDSAPASISDAPRTSWLDDLQTTRDECQIFGNFVASELRSLRSDASRKKLKRIIQKSILLVAEEDDNDDDSTIN